MKKMKKIIFITAGLAAGFYANAQKELQPKQLNIFKTGTYFVVKEGSVSPQNKIWTMEMNVNPLLATFWMTGTKESEIDRIDFMYDSIPNKHTFNGYAELIKANKGKAVTLSYIPGYQSYNPYTYEYNYYNYSQPANNEKPITVSGTIDYYYTATGMVKIKLATGEYKLLNASSVIDVSFKESPKETVEYDSLSRVAKVTFKNAGAKMPVKLSYMQTGISWIPSYNVKIIDDKTLQIEMKALVENYAETMKDVDLMLTIGAMNFKYGTQTDALAQMYNTMISGGTLGSTYNWNNASGLAAQSYAAPVTNYDISAGEYALDEVTVANEPVYDYVNYSTYAVAGDKSNDLFTYKLGKTTLEYGVKSSFSIFSKNISYEEVYEATLWDQINYASTYQITNRDDQVIPVYHSLKLKNETTVPFTTAPVFVQDEKLQPLAQDEVKYTPVGSDVKIQLAQSPDIKIKNTEEEKSFEDRSKKYNNYYYKKIIIKGTVTVENLQDKSIKLDLTKNINGNIIAASESGKIKKTGVYSGINPQSKSDWEINIGANAKKEITYEYEVYIYQGN
jgi:hypothetical protein